MSKVSEKEMFEMLGMFVSGKSVTEISKATGRSKPTVEKYISELKKERQEDEDADQADDNEEVLSEDTAKNRKNTTQFIKKTGEKKISGVSIMTGAESSRGEAVTRKSGAKNPKYLKTIHTISED